MRAMTRRREFLILMAWFAVVVIAWLGPTFTGKAIYALDADLVSYYYPVFHFYSEALHLGQSFLWIPGIFSGFPAYLSQSAGFFDPVNVAIFTLWFGITGIHVRLIIDLFLTLGISYLAARSLGLSRLAAALVGPSYLLSFHLRFISNPIIANTLFLLPLLIYTAHAVFENRMRPLVAGGIAGAGIGWALLSGYTQLVVYAILLAGVYILIRAALRANEWRSFFGRMGIYGCVALAFGACIALPFILPAQEYLPLSARASAIPAGSATLKVIEPGDLLLSIVPDYFYVPYVTAGRKPLYVGALWFMLAVGAILAALRALRYRETRVRHGTLIAVTGTGILTLVAAFKWSPLFAALSYVPVLGLFRFPFRFMFLGAFFLALLGGFGFDRIRDMVSEKLWRFCMYCVAGFAALFTGGVGVLYFSTDAFLGRLADGGHAVLGIVYGHFGFTKDPAAYRAALENALHAVRELLSFPSIDIAIGFGLLIASCAFLLSVLRGGLGNTAMHYALACIVCVTCISVPMSQWSRFVPRHDVGVGEQVLEYYVDTNTAYRMFSFIPTASVANAIPPQYKLSPEEESAVHEVAVRGGTPNVHLYSGISSIDGYDQFEPSDMLRALESIGGEYAAGYGAGTYEERRERLLSRLDVLGMLGGRYILSGVELDHADLDLLGIETISAYKIPLYIYEYTKARPLFYLGKDISAVPHAGFNVLADMDLWFDRKTYLDCETCVQARGKGVLTLKGQKNGKYVFTVESGEDEYLILSESFLPGWKAWINGENTELIRANGLFMAVYVPPGAHTIVFEYQGQNNELGFLKAVGLVNSE